MPTKFSFEGALMNAFRAAHAKTFLWKFALAYALVFTAFLLLVGLLAKDSFIAFTQAVEALTEADFDETDPGAMMAVFFGTLTPLIPWAVLGSIGSGVLWAMFESASQRRYVRDEPFSLRLGADELRMMVVGVLWSVMYLAMMSPLLMVAFNGISALIRESVAGLSEEKSVERLFLTIGSVFGLMLIFFPIYAFFATRLAPCFAMTIKDRKIVFFDAWNVSRGRFWPILGAFLIISIAGGIAASVLGQILQALLMATTMTRFNTVESGDDLARIVLSPAFIVPMGIYAALRLSLTGLLQHVTGAPAAFAARHDPRGGVDDAANISIFD